MKDVIIGASDRYNYTQLQYWVNSIKMSGFDGDIVVIGFNMDGATMKKLTSKGVKIYAGGQQIENGALTFRSNTPVHVERFRWINDFLVEYGHFYRYVITTDIKDVIFQKNPGDWLLDNLHPSPLVVGSELLRYKDEPWGDQNLHNTFGQEIYDQFKNREIFNVGVIAGLKDYVKDLCLQIYLMAVHNPTKICDQAIFNVLMHSEPYASLVYYADSTDDWTVHMGTTNDPSKEAIFDPNLLNEKPQIVPDRDHSYMDWVESPSSQFRYTVVHQYDRVPGFKEKVEKYFSDVP